MRITNIRIEKIENRGKVKAEASIVFDNEFCVNDIRVISGENGLFISLPHKRLFNGEIVDIAHPINSETRVKIQNAILEEYNELN